MTTADTLAQASPALAPTYIRFPDPPERTPEVSTFNHLSLTGSTYLLVEHLGNPETTLVGGDHYIAPEPTRDMTGVKYPDLLIAFNVDPEAYYRRNAYVISEQGKPPDFVLEIASPSTGREDVTEKRSAYEALQIPEYWRFDETPTGRYHRTRLAGDRLVNGRYQPITIVEIEDGILQGYSEVLNLYIRWEHGQLSWHDPATGRRIVTLEDERAARLRAEARAISAEARAAAAEARAGELAAELQRRHGDG